MTDLGYATKIAPELAGMVKPIGDVKRHPQNIRTHDIPKIAQSLQAHGQRTPIVVQESTGLIVKGNGTHEAAELLGWTEIAVLTQEMDDLEAITYLLADNKASDKAKYDRKQTMKVLDSITADQASIWELTGWTAEEREDLDDPVERPVAEFGGDYADAGAANEARKTAAAREGTKMKEVPVVLTIADHAIFMANLEQCQKAWGTSGKIATIVEAVARAASGEVARPQTTNDTALRAAMLRDARDYFLTDGRPTWTMGAIAAFFQSQLAALIPEATPEPTEQLALPEAEGQTGILEQLA